MLHPVSELHLRRRSPLIIAAAVAASIIAFLAFWAISSESHPVITVALALVSGAVAGGGAWALRRLAANPPSALDDMHDTQEAVAAAFARREYSRLAFEAVDEGLVIVDPGLRIQRSNPVARTMACATGTLAGAGWLDTFPLLDDKLDPIGAGDDPVAQAVALGRQVERRAHLRTAEGSMPVHISAIPIEKPDSAAPGCLVVLRDLSAMELQALRSMQTIAEVVHDLRTPLTALQGFAELLQQENTPPEVRREWLGLIRTEASRMGGIIDDILDLARIQQGKASIHCETLAPDDLLREVLSPLQRAASHEISVTWETAPSPIHADGAKMARALSNLVTNAMKYSPRGTTISIGIRSASNGHDSITMFAVTDQGPGIPEGERASIFEPFFRGATWDSTGSAVGGSGLGLAIARAIARLHNGDLTLSCPTRGGSTFTFAIARPAGCRHERPVVAAV